MLQIVVINFVIYETADGSGGETCFCKFCCLARFFCICQQIKCSNFLFFYTYLKQKYNVTNVEIREFDYLFIFML